MILPEDCIREILNHLSEDKKSLYSCLFTNRFFCQCVVPILWKDPWSGLFDLERVGWKILGKTIIKCFPQEIKKSFSKKYKICLNPSLMQQPLFNYVSYIKIIYTGVISQLIINIFDDDNYNYNYQVMQCNVEQIFNKEFWSLFMKQSKIKTLDMPNFNLFEYPGSKNSLSSLSTLKISISFSREMIIDLSKNVHTLKRIEMQWWNELNGSFKNDVETLLFSQKNLKEIAFIFISRQSFHFNKIILEHLSQTLRILEFNSNICLSTQTISSFINLTELKIHLNYLEYHDGGIKNLNQVVLPNLEILSLVNVRGEDLTIFINLIESTKGSLKILDIRLRASSVMSLSLSSSSSIETYLRTIKKSCPKIEVLPVWLISEISLTDFEILLKSCLKIRKIIIHVITPLNRLFDTVLARPVLYLLAVESCIFLNNIHLIGRWSFSNIDIQEFFETWKGMRRKPLKFIFSNNIYSNTIIRVCDFYHQQGVVKKGKINYTTPCIRYW